MKKLLTIILICTNFSDNAGPTVCRKILKEFDNDRNFSVVNITEMFGLMGDMKIDDPDLESLINNIDGLRIVSAPYNKPVYEKVVA